jgi:DNA-directed RNA polymerase specialized sigma24 family protein
VPIQQDANQRRWHSGSLADSTLLHRAAEGDSIAFSELVNRHYGTGVRIAFLLLDDRYVAHSVVQEAFARVYFDLQTANSASRFYIELYRLIIDLCFDARVSWHAESEATLSFTCTKVPLLDRAMLLLRDLAGFSYDDIAGVVGSKRAEYVRSHVEGCGVCRARRIDSGRVREALASQLGNPDALLALQEIHLRIRAERERSWMMRRVRRWVYGRFAWASKVWLVALGIALVAACVSLSYLLR